MRQITKGYKKEIRKDYKIIKKGHGQFKVLCLNY